MILVDDHELVRAGLAALLLMMPGIRVVAEAATGTELLALLDEVEVDVVVCDVSMPDISGLETVERVHRRWPGLRLIMLSMEDSATVAMRALKSGACGYVVKHAAPSELEAAIRWGIEGRPFLSSVITRSLLTAASDAPQVLLTARQREVLTLVSRGFTSREIGEQLGLSHKTVDVHRLKIMERLDIRDVPGLTRYAIRYGLISD